MSQVYQNPKALTNLVAELRSSLPSELLLDEQQVQQFVTYLDLLLKWNLRVGLISPADEERLIKRHVIESLAIIATGALPPDGEVLDLGSGGGLPGIPVKIALPKLRMTLLDSRRMKALFLEEAVRVLALQNTSVVNQRAEKIGEEFSNRFDFVLARAVADLKTLWDWSKPLLKNGGSLLAQKGGDLKVEIAALLNSNSDLQLRQIHFPEHWPIEKSRCLIAIRKA